jgi:hypothetical protein
MKTKFLTIALFASLILIYAEQVKATGRVGSTAWEEVSKVESITIFDRWVSVNDDKFIERMGVVNVNIPADKVFTSLSDANFTTQWMKGVLVNKVINKEANSWEVYSLYNIPWPFEKRELYSLYQTVKLTTGCYEISIQSIDDRKPSPNHQLLTNYRAQWLIKPINSDSSQITLVTFAAIPPMIPERIQYPILLSVFKGNLVRLKTLLEERHIENTNK